MNELSLFSGAGGGLLGTKLLGWQSVGYVENNTYCQKILAQRIKDGFLDEAPIFGDINSFIESGAAEKYRGVVEVLTAGFPCPAYSVAGRREGKFSEKNLWPQTLAVIRLLRPHLRYAFLENVPGLLTVNAGEMFAQILSDLAEIGFDARWTCLGADECGAPHKRTRLWVLAYSTDKGSKERYAERSQQTGEGEADNALPRSKDVADSENIRFSGSLQRQDSTDQGWGELAQVSIERGSSVNYSGQWPTEPDLGRVVPNGLAHRVDRLKAIGNGQVPRVVATAWEILTDESNR